MHDIEVGPVRRLPRAKRRSTTASERKTSGIRDESSDVTSPIPSIHKEGGWFTNSFDSKARQQRSGRSSSNENKRGPIGQSTPKAKRRRKSSGVTGLDTSDALLADIDIDTFVETASQSQGKTLENASHSQGLTHESSNESQANKSIGRKDCSLGDSQYFSARFANYKGTQPRSQSHNPKEVIVKNKLTQQKPNGTRTLRSGIKSQPVDSQVGSSPAETQFSTTQVLSDANYSQVLNSEEWDAKEPVTSTQVSEKCPIKADPPDRLKFRCTPYSAKILEVSKADETGTLSQNNAEDSVIVDISMLKDVSSSKDSAKTCTPLKANDLQSSQSYSQSTLGEITRLDITQLKNEGDENFRYRCTPYKAGDKCTSTQNGTQAELVSGTQYITKLNDSNNIVISQVTQIGRNVLGTQFMNTQICDMTGVIVDSQDACQPRGLNTSDCDIFSDSFQGVEPVSQKGQSSRLSKGCHGENEEVTSHTQTLVANSQLIDRDVDAQECADNLQPVIGVVQENRIKSSSDASDRSSVRLTGINQNGETNSFVSKVPGETQASTKLGAGSSVTPGRAGSLQEKIKQRLKQNIGQTTPKGAANLVERLREQVLERVKLEADRQSTSDDVGPFYGLPSRVQHLFENYRGIKKFYDWQDECLRLPAVTERRNLIYSLPTSGGKTLVAEILILKALLCLKQDALLILPFVSIVQEKVRNMSEFAVDLNFHVEEYAGSKGRFPPVKRRKNRSLFIATIEKAHSIINSLTEADRIDSLGLVVVDELHMLGEGGSRGATLESTLMKILQAGGATQIIGMSATLSNIADLQKFLNADIYTNDFRPVKLTEYVKLSDSIYSVDQKAKSVEDQFTHDRCVCFQYPPEMEKMDPDHLLGLALEVIPDNSCLIFCHTKKNCENVAYMLSKLMMKYKRELHEVKKKERHSLLKELYNDSEGKVCPTLRVTIPWGLAYHHSGLTMDERKLIEDAYAGGTLCLLACTSTLAAGVNLPAKRVILRAPYVGQSFISRSQYKQMVGRAGRAGIDTSGESILICKSSDREKICELLAGPIEKCHSSLVYNGGKGIRTLLLSTIGLKITTTTEDVFRFVSRSLCHIQQVSLCVDVNQMCRDALQVLIDSGLVVQTKAHAEDPVGEVLQHSLEVTELGLATFKGPIDPDFACRLYEDLKQAEEPLVISTHLHLLYLVTPYDTVNDVQPSWFIYFNQMSALSPSEQKVASLIGVPESYIARLASQQKSKQRVDEFVVKRFYLTLMLYDLWRQKSVWEVAERYQQPRGFIQSLLSSAASFASCVGHFCQEMKQFWAYQDLMGNFVKQLSYCVTAELIPLMEIPGIKLGRARLMFDAGYKTLSAVAGAQPDDVVNAVKFMPRKEAQQVVASAKLLLSEKAEAMMEEMEQLVTIPTNMAVPVTMATEMTTPALLQTPSLSQLSTESTLAENEPSDKT